MAHSGAFLKHGWVGKLASHVDPITVANGEGRRRVINSANCWGPRMFLPSDGALVANSEAESRQKHRLKCAGGQATQNDGPSYEAGRLRLRRAVLQRLCVPLATSSGSYYASGCAVG